jgi:hypothetical protein
LIRQFLGVVQAAIPLATITAQRVTNRYDLVRPDVYRNFAGGSKKTREKDQTGHLDNRQVPGFRSDVFRR